MKQGLNWLVSYPKSGNTWMRTFLANLTKKNEHKDEDTDTPVDINELTTGTIASSRGWIDAVLGYDSETLSADEIDWIRPQVYRHTAQEQDAEQIPDFHKVHDAWTTLSDGTALFPDDVVKACVYIVRNPLDVAVSLSHHNQSSIDNAIGCMSNPGYQLCGSTKRHQNQLRQKMLTWSEHVQSWTTAPKLNVKVIRYEDMKNSPHATFSGVADFLEIGCNANDIKQAILASSMEKLQQQETESAFKERPPGMARFFRKGIVGDWENCLRPDQVERIRCDHTKIMHQLGY